MSRSSSACARRLPALLLGLTLACSAALLAGCGGGGGSDDGGGGGGGSGGGPGSASLAVDANPLRATAQADTARAVEQLLSRAGGELVATGADGTVYRLSVPEGALVEPTTIRMAPLAALTIADLDADQPRGVQLEPAGTQFHGAAQLRIEPPAGAALPVERQLPLAWSGAGDMVALASLQPTREIVLEVPHFSGYALLLARTGTNATLAPVRHRLGGAAEERLQSLAAERLLQERQRQLLGQSDGDLELDDILEAYDEEVVQPRVAAAGSSCAAGRLAVQTVLGRSRTLQLLGREDDDLAHSALHGELMRTSTRVCTQEEYALCRDEHIITRMLPYYLGLRRQAELLGMVTADPTGDPDWLHEALAATANCLNFELQFDSSMELVDGATVDQHSVRENVSARVVLPFNMGVALFEDSLHIATTQQPATLSSSGYTVRYPHACASVDQQLGLAASMVASIGYAARSGSVAERAQVQDFYLTPAVIPSGLGSHYQRTLRTPSGGGCANPSTNTQYESWVVDAHALILEQFADPELGAAIRQWSIVGGDVQATKDFSSALVEGERSVSVQTRLVLFHKPAP